MPQKVEVSRDRCQEHGEAYCFPCATAKATWILLLVGITNAEHFKMTLHFADRLKGTLVSFSDESISCSGFVDSSPKFVTIGHTKEEKQRYSLSFKEVESLLLYRDAAWWNIVTSFRQQENSSTSLIYILHEDGRDKLFQLPFNSKEVGNFAVRNNKLLDRNNPYRWSRATSISHRITNIQMAALTVEPKSGFSFWQSSEGAPRSVRNRELPLGIFQGLLGYVRSLYRRFRALLRRIVCIAHFVPLPFGITSVINRGNSDYDSRGGSPKTNIGNDRPQPAKNYIAHIKGLSCLFGGGICVFFGILFVGAGGVGTRENWRLGAAVIIVGTLLLFTSIRLIFHAIDLLDPALVRKAAEQSVFLSGTLSKKSTR